MYVHVHIATQKKDTKKKKTHPKEVGKYMRASS